MDIRIKDAIAQTLANSIYNETLTEDKLQDVIKVKYSESAVVIGDLVEMTMMHYVKIIKDGVKSN